MVKLLFFIGVLLTVAPCWGAPALVLAGRGNGLYELLGEGLEDVKVMELTLTYDPATLMDPRIGQRGLIFGSMVIPDMGTPGSIRVNITSPNPQGIKGSGSIAMFTFNPAGRGAGKITSFAVTLTSTQGSAIPVTPPRILADDKGRFLGNPFSPDQPQGENPPGAITGTLAQWVEEKPAALDTPVSQGPESILSRFKGYTGPLTIPALTGLFSQRLYSECRQEPPIALSDGVATVVVSLAAEAPPAQSPNFAVIGGKLLSLKFAGGWYLLEIVPDAGLYESSVTVLTRGGVAEYPLVVAPSLPPGATPGGEPDDATFANFLREYSGGKGDANHDGRSDYLDLYLYTAHYLVRTKGRQVHAAFVPPVDPLASVKAQLPGALPATGMLPVVAPAPIPAQVASPREAASPPASSAVGVTGGATAVKRRVHAGRAHTGKAGHVPSAASVRKGSRNKKTRKQR